MAVLADMNPMCWRTCWASAATSKPATRAVPPLGRSTVHRMRMVVVLPAPLGPSRPKISPGRASKLTWSTAYTSPRRRSRNDLVRFLTWIIRRSRRSTAGPGERRFAEASLTGRPPRCGSDHGERPSALGVGLTAGRRPLAARLGVYVLIEHVALARDVARFADGAFDLLQGQVVDG